jgi:hypothetical protein
MQYVRVSQWNIRILTSPLHQAIHSVTVGGHQADFAHRDPMSNISVTGTNEDAPDVHKHPELKRKIYSALQESDEGELSIGIPRDVALKQATLTGGYALRESAYPKN